MTLEDEWKQILELKGYKSVLDKSEMIWKQHQINIILKLLRNFRPKFILTFQRGWAYIDGVHKSKNIQNEWNG